MTTDRGDKSQQHSRVFTHQLLVKMFLHVNFQHGSLIIGGFFQKKNLYRVIKKVRGKLKADLELEQQAELLFCIAQRSHVPLIL